MHGALARVHANDAEIKDQVEALVSGMIELAIAAASSSAIYQLQAGHGPAAFCSIICVRRTKFGSSIVQ